MPPAVPAPNLAPDPSLLGSRTAALASGAVAAVIDAGAKILIAEPWRAARIIRGAEALTFDELATHFARRRAAPFADFNRAIAFAQLGRALESPYFRTAWDEWRRAVE
jgi:hypothetical protein